MYHNAYFNITNLSKLQKNLDKETMKTDANSLATPHLNCKNGLLHGKENYFEKTSISSELSGTSDRKIEETYQCDYRKQLYWLPNSTYPRTNPVQTDDTTWKAPKYQV